MKNLFQLIVIIFILLQLIQTTIVRKSYNHRILDDSQRQYYPVQFISGNVVRNSFNEKQIDNSKRAYYPVSIFLQSDEKNMRKQLKSKSQSPLNLLGMMNNHYHPIQEKQNLEQTDMSNMGKEQIKSDIAELEQINQVVNNQKIKNEIKEVKNLMKDLNNTKIESDLNQEETKLALNEVEKTIVQDVAIENIMKNTTQVRFSEDRRVNGGFSSKSSLQMIKLQSDSLFSVFQRFYKNIEHQSEIFLQKYGSPQHYLIFAITVIFIFGLIFEIKKYQNLVKQKQLKETLTEALKNQQIDV